MVQVCIFIFFNQKKTLHYYEISTKKYGTPFLYKNIHYSNQKQEKKNYLL